MSKSLDAPFELVDSRTARLWEDHAVYVQAACEALKSARCLEIFYDGFSRVVEVHAVGYTTDGKGVMRVWQVRGASVSGAEKTLDTHQLVAGSHS